MNKMTVLRQITVSSIKFFLLGALILPGTAYAYVDPGSGSVIVTAILGALGAIAYTFRKYFYKVRNLFSKKDLARPDSEQ